MKIKNNIKQPNRKEISSIRTEYIRNKICNSTLLTRLKLYIEMKE